MLEFKGETLHYNKGEGALLPSHHTAQKASMAKAL